MAILHVILLSKMQNNTSSRPLLIVAARLGVNLGPSPYHARNVNLVLNQDTGHCSPQFHCQYNDFIETIDLIKPEMMTSSNWQSFTGL
ncbi:hypothetical protein ACHAW6_008826, partial [Cyclotella cf. meneghiniana]